MGHERLGGGTKGTSKEGQREGQAGESSIHFVVSVAAGIRSIGWGLEGEGSDGVVEVIDMVDHDTAVRDGVDEVFEEKAATYIYTVVASAITIGVFHIVKQGGVVHAAATVEAGVFVDVEKFEGASHLAGVVPSHEGECEQAMGIVVGEGLVVGLGLGVSVNLFVRKHVFVLLNGIDGIGDVEDLQRKSVILTDGEQVIAVERMHVLGEAGDFQFTEDRGGGGVRQVEDKEGVDLAESDEVAAISHETCGVNTLGGGQVAQASDDLKFIVLRTEDENVIGLPVIPIDVDPLVGGGDAQVAVMHIERELIQDRSDDGSGSDVLWPERVEGQVE